MPKLSIRQPQVSPFRGIAGGVRIGTRLFLAHGQEGLMVFDLRNGVPELVAHLREWPAFDLAVRKDGFLAVAAGQKGIVVLHPTTLRPVRVIATKAPAHSVGQAGREGRAPTPLASPYQASILTPLQSAPDAPPPPPPPPPSFPLKALTPTPTPPGRRR